MPAAVVREPGAGRAEDGGFGQVGLAAALLAEEDAEQAAATAQQVLDHARPYKTADVDEARTRARDLTFSRSTAVAPEVIGPTGKNF